MNNVKNETKIENERKAFEQTFKHFCLDKKLDAWGESIYAYDAIQLAWESWLKSKETIQPNPWQCVMDNALVCAHIGVAKTNATLEEASTALNKLMDFHTEVAINPQTNGGMSLQQAPMVEFPQYRKKGCSDWYDGYADLFDGGGPYEERVLFKPDESVNTDKKDAARWRELIRHIGARTDKETNLPCYYINYFKPPKEVFKGSVAQHFTKSIDAFIKGTQP